MSKITLVLIAGCLLLTGIKPIQAAVEPDEAVRQLASKLMITSEGHLAQVGETGLLYIVFERQQGLIEGSMVNLVRPSDPVRVGSVTVGRGEEPVGVAKLNRLFPDNKALAHLEGEARMPPKIGDKVYAGEGPQGQWVITPFTYNGQPTEFSVTLQEKLVTELVRQGVPVVERSHLEKVLQEQELTYSGLVDLTSAHEVGKLLGANGMVLGTIVDQGNSVAVNARLVSLETAGITVAAEVTIAKTPTVSQGLQRLVAALGTTPANVFGQVPITPLSPETGMMIGSMKDKGETVEIKAQMVDLKTSKVLATTIMELPKDQLLGPFANGQIPDTLITQPFLTSTPTVITSTGAVTAGIMPQAGTVTASELELTVDNCQGLGTVTCGMRVTNRGVAQAFEFHAAWTLLVDEKGNAYRARSVQIGTQTHADKLSQEFAPGYSQRVSFVFEGLAPDTRRASLKPAIFSLRSGKPLDLSALNIVLTR
ncbi:MAG: hypothetical protein HC808_11530 [Candidatus Competibacteraceae bacterium]|nr:hypothetical protein [Candidatus Competibacteraceae bacterium]